MWEAYSDLATGGHPLGRLEQATRLCRKTHEPGNLPASATMPFPRRNWAPSLQLRTPASADGTGVFHGVEKGAGRRGDRRIGPASTIFRFSPLPRRRLLCMAAGAARAAEPLYETVVVAEAVAENRARQDDAASSSLITSSRTPRSAEDLPQLLSELPGVSVTRLGGLGSMATLSLRGSSADQVEVYFDGVPLSPASGGGVDIGLIPVVDLESIEVYRGMSPIGFGTSAMGGIVSLSSATPTNSGVRAYAGGGSFGTGFAGVQGRWAGNNLRALASVNGLGSAGDFTYANDNATRLHHQRRHHQPPPEQCPWPSRRPGPRCRAVAWAATDLGHSQFPSP